VTGGLALSLLLGTLAAPSEISGQPFWSVWRIDPTPATFLNFQMEARSVVSQHDVLRTTLVPEQSIALQGELVSPDGAFRLGAGVRFDVQSSKVMIACTVIKRSSSVWVKFNQGSEKMLCAIDSDRDGSFDLMFTRKYRLLGYIDVRDEIPNDLVRIAPVRYAQAEPAITGARPIYSLAFYGYRKKKSALVFRLESGAAAGVALGTWCTSKEILVPYTSGEHRFEVAGGAFTVTAYDEAADAVAIAVNQSFAPDVIHCGDKV